MSEISGYQKSELQNNLLYLGNGLGDPGDTFIFRLGRGYFSLYVGVCNFLSSIHLNVIGMSLKSLINVANNPGFFVILIRSVFSSFFLAIAVSRAALWLRAE